MQITYTHTYYQKAKQKLGYKSRIVFLILRFL